MASNDDQEISSVSASNNRSQLIGIAVVAGVLFIVVYLTMSGSSERTKESDKDAPAYSLNYSKPAGDQYANLNTPTKKESSLAALDNLAPKNKPVLDRQSSKRNQELTARLRSPMVVVYDKKGLSDQYQIAAIERLENTGTLSQEAVLKKMITHSNQTVNEQFAVKAYSGGIKVVKASKLTDLDYTVLQGKTIAAVLETPVNTNLPGMLKAVVSRHVYGERGRIPLIPAGSRLIGSYNASTIQGQVRVYIVWTRIITPDFVNIRINSPGADQMGMAGMAGKVNNHFFKRFGNAILLSILGAGTMIAGVDAKDQYNSISSIREQVASNLNVVSTSQLTNAANIKPTITVPQGTRITVLVAQDVKFTPIQDRYNKDRN